LNHLRFVDDSVLIAKNTIKLQKMLQGLDTKISQVGLKVNRSKMKFMRFDALPKAQIIVKGEQIEVVEQYVCLGQEINTHHDQENYRKESWLVCIQLYQRCPPRKNQQGNTRQPLQVNSTASNVIRQQNMGTCEDRGAT
ncbi:hypothetical protein G0U57_017312, partial [Chelydra serpentina]